MGLGSREEEILAPKNGVITNSREIMVNQQQLPRLAFGPNMALAMTPTTAGAVMKDFTLDSN